MPANSPGWPSAATSFRALAGLTPHEGSTCQMNAEGVTNTRMQDVQTIVHHLPKPTYVSPALPWPVAASRHLCRHHPKCAATSHQWPTAATYHRKLPKGTQQKAWHGLRMLRMPRTHTCGLCKQFRKLANRHTGLLGSPTLWQQSTQASPQVVP
jgi:hypothetical protein